MAICSVVKPVLFIAVCSDIKSASHGSQPQGALAVIAWNDGERGVAAFKSLDEVALAGTIAFALQFAQEAKTNVFWNAVIVVDVL